MIHLILGNPKMFMIFIVIVLLICVLSVVLLWEKIKCTFSSITDILPIGVDYDNDECD